MTDDTHGLYGAPPAELADPGEAPVQFSPLVPGAAALEAQAPETLGAMTMLAPPGTIERRYALALALRALQPGAALTALAPRDKGGSRLAGELRAFGCTVEESARRHYRICLASRPSVLDGIDDALAKGGPRYSSDLGLWSQPGVFSWDRIDPGSALLAGHLPELAGAGADLGCGLGVLARAVLASLRVDHLTLLDIDRRAVEAARRNVDDPRATILWADALDPATRLAGLDFVVMNPPFHDGGAEDRTLGQSFIRRAASALRKGGTLWLVANRHLPYEAVLAPLFRRVTLKAEAGGYKIHEAVR